MVIQPKAECIYECTYDVRIYIKDDVFPFVLPAKALSPNCEHVLERISEDEV